MIKKNVITRTGYETLENYEDSHVNIRLYRGDRCSVDHGDVYEVEIIDLDEDIYNYYIYENAWGPALDKYNFLVSRHIHHQSLEDLNVAIHHEDI